MKVIPVSRTQPNTYSANKKEHSVHYIQTPMVSFEGKKMGFLEAFWDAMKHSDADGPVGTFRNDVRKNMGKKPKDYEALRERMSSGEEEERGRDPYPSELPPFD